jgi:hypothetical protein
VNDEWFFKNFFSEVVEGDYIAQVPYPVFCVYSVVDDVKILLRMAL